MKKIIAILLVLSLACIGLIACNAPTTPPEGGTTTPESNVTTGAPDEGVTDPVEDVTTTEAEVTTTEAEDTTEVTTPEETYAEMPDYDDGIKDDVAEDDFPPM